MILKIPNKLRFNARKLQLLCEANRELRIECYNKKFFQKLILMCPTGFETGNRNIRIGASLWIWNAKYRLGEICDSSTGFILPDGDMLSPDASWVSNEKLKMLSEEEKKKFLPFCPDFLIELRSSSDSLKKLQKKMEKWMRNGCHLAWLLDFENKKAYIYRTSGMEIQHLNEKPILSGENILPNFEFQFC